MKTTPSSRRRGRVMLCFGTAIILAVAAPVPALAEPPEFASVPDDGSRPDGDPGDVSAPSPGQTPVSGPGVSRGPYANRIAEQAREVAELGEATTAAEQDLDDRRTAADAAYQHWFELNSEAVELADLAADLAAEHYEDSAAEIRGVTDEFDALFEVNPELLSYTGTDIVAQAEEAATAADLAKTSLDAARAAVSIATGTHRTLSDDLADKNAALEDLIADNAEAIALEEAKNEADNSNNYDLGDIGTDIDGLRAADAAQAAVEWAVDQLGKPYQWGAEGPQSFDCSGLVQAAYGAQGVSIPRVANDQFRATSDKPVDVGQLLPGDLIFYGDVPGDWTSVYHVTMYIGDGKMVQAPRPGDVVKVTAVSFSDFFGAHRVVDAVAVPDDTDPEADGTTDDPTEPADDATIREEPETDVDGSTPTTGT